MKSLLFVKTNDSLSSHLESLLRDSDEGNQVEVYRTVASLELRLRSSGNKIDITVLSVPDKETLEKLLGIGELFRDIPLVAIVPDSREETMSLAHELRPRYLHSNKNQLADLGLVLRNMYSARQAQ